MSLETGVFKYVSRARYFFVMQISLSMFVFFLPSRCDVTNAAADEITATVFEPHGGYMTAVKDISAQSNAHESDSPKV